MANNNKEPKKEYKAFDGKILFDYKGSRDAGIKFYNSTHFSFGKPFQGTRLEKPIPYLDWNEMVAKIAALDDATAAEMKHLTKQYYRKKFQYEEQLMEEMLFPAIDKLLGFDKVIEEMTK